MISQQAAAIYLDSLSRRLTQDAGKRDLLRENLRSLKDEEDLLRQEAVDLAAALEAIQVVAKLTQQELKVHVEELVSLALEAVFPSPYRLVLNFETRRNRTEADLLLRDGDGSTVDPLAAVGGGVVDVTALALRIALWSLKSPRPRPTIVLDEPLRYLSRELQPRASAVLKELSSKLGIQFIIVTHEENLLEAADEVFEVSKDRDGRSFCCGKTKGDEKPCN